MKTAKLTRFFGNKAGTFGDLLTPAGRHYSTVERPWLNNQRSISCIPSGEYICKPRRFNRGGYDAIEVTGVEGRTHILMHVANFPYEVEGCIGINHHHVVQAGRWRGVNSRNSFNSLMSELGGETFKLIIKNQEDGKS